MSNGVYCGHGKILPYNGGIGCYAYVTLLAAWAQALPNKPELLFDYSTEISPTNYCVRPRDFDGYTIDFHGETREFTVEPADDFLEKALAALKIKNNDDVYHNRLRRLCTFYLKLDYERFIIPDK